MPHVCERTSMATRVKAFRHLRRHLAMKATNTTTKAMKTTKATKTTTKAGKGKGKDTKGKIGK